MLTTAPIAAATTTAAACTLGLRARLIYIDRPTAELAAIQSGNCLLAFFCVGHLYETKATRTPGLTIRQNAHAIHLPVRLEQLAQLIFGCVEAEIANKNVLHSCPFFLSANRRKRPANRKLLDQGSLRRRKYSKFWAKWSKLLYCIRYFFAGVASLALFDLPVAIGLIAKLK